MNIDVGEQHRPGVFAHRRPSEGSARQALRLAIFTPTLTGTLKMDRFFLGIYVRLVVFVLIGLLGGRLQMWFKIQQQLRAPVQAPSAQRTEPTGTAVLSAEAIQRAQLQRLFGSKGALRQGPLLPTLLMAGLLVGLYLSLRPIRQRLRRLAATSDRLGSGDLTARADEGSKDVIGVLARSFNQMAAQLQRLISAQQEILRVVSHELRTPLQRLHFLIEQVRDTHDEAARATALERMERDLAELDHLIDELLTYSRLEDGSAIEQRRVDAGAIALELCETLAPPAGTVKLVLRGSLEGPLDVPGERRLVRRALSNLISNALRHARSRVEVAVQREAGHILIQVEDDGPGVPPANRERIFEPFWCQQAGREEARAPGFGLGLAIVRRIAVRGGGGVEVFTSQPLGGAGFQLRLAKWTAGDP